METLTFDMILSAFMVHKALESGDISTDEARLLMHTLREHHGRFQGKDFTLYFLRKQGIATCCLVSSAADLVFESGIKIVSRISASSCTEELKIKLS